MVTAIRIIISFLCIHAFIAGLLLDAYCALIFTCVIMGIGYALYFGIQRLIVWMREVDAQYLGNVIHNNWRRIGQYLVYITAIVILCTSFFVDDNSIIKRLVPYANVIIGIFITFLVMLPDFEIGDTLALSLNNRLRVNVRNNFLLFKLYNVKVELEYQKYDEKTKDTISWPINMSGENLTALDGRWRGTEKSSQTFHTKNAFIWDDSYDEIICRVQVTHSVSRLIRVKEKVFRRDKHIKPGEYVNGVFCDIERVYPNDELTRKRCAAITEFSQKVLPASIPYPIDEYGQRNVAGKYQIALDAIQTFRTRKDLFPNIEDYKNAFDELKEKISNPSTSTQEQPNEGLLQIYTNNRTLHLNVKKHRDDLVNEINSLVLYISHYLERQITRKNNL